jgi:hypothetical protein
MSNGESSKACTSSFPWTSVSNKLMVLTAKDVSPAVDFAAGVVGGMLLILKTTMWTEGLMEV